MSYYDTIWADLSGYFPDPSKIRTEVTTDASLPPTLPEIPPEPAGEWTEAWLDSLPIDDALRFAEAQCRDWFRLQQRMSAAKSSHRRACRAIARRMIRETGRTGRTVDGITYWPHDDLGGLERSTSGKRGGQS